MGTGNDACAFAYSDQGSQSSTYTATLGKWGRFIIHEKMNRLHFLLRAARSACGDALKLILDVRDQGDECVRLIVNWALFQLHAELLASIPEKMSRFFRNG